MSVVLTKNAEIALFQPKLNRVAVWRFVHNSTGDNSGGSIVFNFATPLTRDLLKAESYPLGLFLTVELLRPTSDESSTQLYFSLNSQTTNLPDYAGGGAQKIMKMTPIASDGAGLAPTQDIALYNRPLFLGRLANLYENQIFSSLTCANVNTKKYDCVAYFGAWNGIPSYL